MLAQMSAVFISRGALAGGESLSLLEFRTNGIFATNETGETYSGQLGWNPSYLLSESLTLRGNVGGSVFKGALAEKFLVLDFGALAGYAISPALEAELGAGIQNWSSRGTWFCATGTVSWNFEQRLLNLVDRVFAGYSRVFQTSASNEFRLGIGISFYSLKGAGETVASEGGSNVQK
ncbi:MAG: hypothetical protein NDJ89_04805 [Oligoflexia bacterium]|nr:hypothetical protein [Oligoflexia bacterium]